jgi:hypothetical protein
MFAFCDYDTCTTNNGFFCADVMIKRKALSDSSTAASRTVYCSVRLPDVCGTDRPTGFMPGRCSSIRPINNDCHYVTNELTSLSSINHASHCAVSLSQTRSEIVRSLSVVSYMQQLIVQRRHMRLSIARRIRNAREVPLLTTSQHLTASSIATRNFAIHFLQG